ncbi:3-oxo-5-alpha-steroid 4-dehydrogenase, putative [Talaromyces stipitatus ATCC 10500]|uniref:Polyprenal reductase n=1 Tax=Talaromyces stipitatus (strain ATCC 10500 / CBS 375.48 / QM 6759 / NRRL 1006) TaxID=441959 RepID=B8M5Y1_TALSN|nr:3-oxo-5-alpha-steroid 4-dehydrogenase, putative [Talaromyces stipitatus ATCC 10500]EED20108.1 3-oxo-5-alpha-steroid 4-dehydrogenase, putative [Talaromyces stipitatus ATCC 10500]
MPSSETSIVQNILGMDVADLIRLCFIFAACTTFTFFSIPVLNIRFVNYGARTSGRNNAVPSKSAAHEPTDESSSTPSHNAGFISQLMDTLTTWQVPHRYFTHYYVLSVLSSAFWISQLLSKGPAFRFVASNMSEEHLQNSMTVHQVILCTTLMLIQGGRRLYESFALAKPSSSRMWVVHWLLGLCFYAGITTAVWIEGSGSVLSTTLTIHDLRVSQVPSLRTLLCLPIFLIASGTQHDAHHYLSSLKGYTVPKHPLFQWIICPHYTAECAIYLSLAFLAAPHREIVNKSVLCGLLFVVANLGVTAYNTEKWYKAKFGEDSVRGKWKMIPGIF